MPRQPTHDMYIDMLDQDMQRLAGAIVDVFDVYVDTLSQDDTKISVSIENMCGTMRSYHDEVDFAGGLLRRDAIRVGVFKENAVFTGTHTLFNTLHGRCTYHDKDKAWKFKGSRSLEGLVEIIRDLADDHQTPLYPSVRMLSATVRTGASLVIDPSRALLNNVINQLYSKVARVIPRTDDVNNLYFLEISSWKSLMRLLRKEEGDDKEIQSVNSFLEKNKKQPKASVGYTRLGVFFIRIAFTEGCLCAVPGSQGIDHTRVPDGVVECGVEPFINALVRFIRILLVKMRAVGYV